MAGIGRTNTVPEMRVRRYLRATGLSFRLHDKRLSGKPDIVLPAFKTAVFVHGCFRHRHPGCSLTANPATNIAF
ncbi:hypothetical protein [Acidovorax sp.]|uniref:hypothetical protein n=1 Tax=Acidovorax sp. TaxID=1872122 RepID=UPI003A0FEB7F